MKILLFVALVATLSCSKSKPVSVTNPPLKHWGNDSSVYVGNDTGTVKKQ